MLRKTAVAVLLGLLLAPATRAAETNYLGLMYGEVGLDDQNSSFEVETGNAGIIAGGISDRGFGFEIFYAATTKEDQIFLDGDDIGDAKIDTFGIYAVYQFGSDLFFRLKGGLAYADFELDIDGLGSFDNSTSGISYGGSVGVRIGPGVLEGTYLVLPEFDDFRAIDLEADIDLLSIAYLWEF